MNLQTLLLRKTTFVILLFLCAIAQAQNAVEPGSTGVDANLILKGTFSWSWFQDERREVGSEKVSVQLHNPWLIFVRRSTSRELDVDKTDSLVLNHKTLAPHFRSFKSEEVSYSIQYGSTVKGTRTRLGAGRNETFNQPLDGKYFDAESLPLIVSCLPLHTTYSASILTIDFDKDFKPMFSRYKITAVSDIETVSAVSGTRMAWKVILKEKRLSPDPPLYAYEYVLYIDKATRRILRVDRSISGALFSDNFFDKETDVNPIKASFNSEETLAQISKGTAIIKGQAYFRGYGKRFNDARDKKKQYAEKGSIVVLIPNTLYFKEWAEYNVKLSKLTGPVYTIDWGGMLGQTGEKNKTVIGTYYPLPEAVAKCMLVTTVIDDKGNFGFQNLKPGEYLLFVSYVVDQYSHTTRQYMGQSTTVYGDGSISSYPVWDTKDWTTPNNVKAHHYVTIKKEGEVVEVLFKD